VSSETLRDWLPLEDLLGLPLGDRIRYVRTNLATPRATARNPGMSHDDFAAAVGAPDRGAPIGWEKGRVPRAYRERIAALTPYPPAAFGGAGEAELVRETLGRRLRLLEAEVGERGRVQDLLIEHLGLVQGEDGCLVRARTSTRARPAKAARGGSAS
jgi:hypothetical protein